MKIRVVTLCLIVLFGPALDALAQDKIRVGLGSISLQSGLVHIGKDRGLFAKYGLVPEPIYIPGGSTNVQVLISGNLDLSQLSGAPGVAANLEGADIVYFAGLLDKLNYQLIARSDIKSIEQLKGKKFAVSRYGSSADFGMRAMLKRVGVDPVKEATILQIGDEPARIAAITSGNVDSTRGECAVQQRSGTIEAQRARRLGEDERAVLQYRIARQPAFLGKTRRQSDELPARLSRSDQDSQDRARVFRQSSGQFTRVSNVKALQEGYDYFVNQLANVPYPSLEAMQAVVAQIAESNPKARGIDAKSYVNDRYLKRLEEEGFVKKLWGK